MAKKGRNIYKRKDGRWEGRYKKGYDDKGKIKYGYVYGKTFTGVRDKLRDFPLIEKEKIYQPTEIRYSHILNEWLEYIRLKVKESSYTRYYQIVYSHLIPNLGSYKIEDITPPVINNLALKLLKSGRTDNKGGLSPKSVSDINSVIKSTILFANVKGYTVNSNIKLLPIRQSTQSIRVLSVMEQSLLCKELLSETDLIKFGILLSLYTGIRIGEVCALKWENIDVSSGTLYVRSTMQRIKNTDAGAKTKTKIIISAPKSENSVRDIPMTFFLAEKARQFKSDDNSYVLTGKANKFIEPRTLQNNFKKYVAKCGIENANYHCLRHTFATRCIELGFEVKTLSEILGHSNVNITLNRYVHSSFELKKHEMEKLII